MATKLIDITRQGRYLLSDGRQVSVHSGVRPGFPGRELFYYYRNRRVYLQQSNIGKRIGE